MSGFKGRKKGEEQRVRAVPPCEPILRKKFMGRVALEGAAAVED